MNQNVDYGDTKRCQRFLPNGKIVELKLEEESPEETSRIEAFKEKQKQREKELAEREKQRHKQNDSLPHKTH